MITLEQIRALESRVRDAVGYIDALKNENTTLKTRLDEARRKVTELEDRVQRISEDQSAIEESVLSALSELDRIEDRLTSPEVVQPPEQSPQASPPVAEAHPGDAATDSAQDTADGDPSPPAEAADDGATEDPAEADGAHPDGESRLDIF